MAEIKKLLKGYREFYQKYFQSGDELYKSLKDGQSPKTLIIACSDSRVDPSIVTAADPGDIFVIRNVANLVPPYQVKESGLHGVSAALEFAVRFLEVKHIVIMGHSSCAGINALLNQEKIADTDFIGKWMAVAGKARERTLECGHNHSDSENQSKCEKESILLSLDNLLSFPWISERVGQKSLKLHGWYFSVEDGRMQEFNPESQKFQIIEI